MEQSCRLDWPTNVQIDNVINFYIEGSVWDFDFLINWIVMRFRNDIAALLLAGFM
mgnify:CR=1